MKNQEEEISPKVFISYSHDTPQHRQWVGELASKLVHKGVDVILDQWDLGPGDDIPKFMEKGVAEADRVLMICTEPYVKKADEGKGGVGYESMIVTGELVQNLFQLYGKTIILDYCLNQLAQDFKWLKMTEKAPLGASNSINGEHSKDALSRNEN